MKVIDLIYHSNLGTLLKVFERDENCKDISYFIIVDDGKVTFIVENEDFDYLVPIISMDLNSIFDVLKNLEDYFPNTHLNDVIRFSKIRDSYAIY